MCVCVCCDIEANYHLPLFRAYEIAFSGIYYFIHRFVRRHQPCRHHRYNTPDKNKKKRKKKKRRKKTINKIRKRFSEIFLQFGLHRRQYCACPGCVRLCATRLTSASSDFFFKQQFRSQSCRLRCEFLLLCVKIVDTTSKRINTFSAVPHTNTFTHNGGY